MKKNTILKSTVALALGTSVVSTAVAPGAASAATYKVNAKGQLVKASTGKVVKGNIVYKGKLYKNGKLAKAKTYTIVGSGSKLQLFYGATLKKGTKTAKGQTLLFKNGKLATGSVQAGNGERLYVNGKLATGYTVYTDKKGEKTLYQNGKVKKGTKTATRNGVTQLFVNGKLAEGEVLFKNVLYTDGGVSKGLVEHDGTFYNNGKLANGEVEGAEFLNGTVTATVEEVTLKKTTAQAEEATKALETAVATKDAEKIEEAAKLAVEKAAAQAEAAKAVAEKATTEATLEKAQKAIEAATQTGKVAVDAAQEIGKTLETTKLTAAVEEAAKVVEANPNKPVVEEPTKPAEDNKTPEAQKPSTDTPAVVTPSTPSTPSDSTKPVIELATGVEATQTVELAKLADLVEPATATVTDNKDTAVKVTTTYQVVKADTAEDVKTFTEAKEKAEVGAKIVITYTATDKAGNKADAKTVEISVLEDVKEAALAIESVEVLDAQGIAIKGAVYDATNNKIVVEQGTKVSAIQFTMNEDLKVSEGEVNFGQTELPGAPEGITFEGRAYGTFKAEGKTVTVTPGENNGEAAYVGTLNFVLSALVSDEADHALEKLPTLEVTAKPAPKLQEATATVNENPQVGVLSDDEKTLNFNLPTGSKTTAITATLDQEVQALPENTKVFVKVGDSDTYTEYGTVTLSKDKRALTIEATKEGYQYTGRDNATFVFATGDAVTEASQVKTLKGLYGAEMTIPTITVTPEIQKIDFPVEKAAIESTTTTLTAMLTDDIFYAKGDTPTVLAKGEGSVAPYAQAFTLVKDGVVIENGIESAVYTPKSSETDAEFDLTFNDLAAGTYTVKFDNTPSETKAVLVDAKGNVYASTEYTLTVKEDGTHTLQAKQNMFPTTAVSLTTENGKTNVKVDLSEKIYYTNTSGTNPLVDGTGPSYAEYKNAFKVVDAANNTVKIDNATYTSNDNGPSSFTLTTDALKDGKYTVEFDNTSSSTKAALTNEVGTAYDSMSYTLTVAGDNVTMEPIVFPIKKTTASTTYNVEATLKNGINFLDQSGKILALEDGAGTAAPYVDAFKATDATVQKATYDTTGEKPTFDLTVEKAGFASALNITLENIKNPETNTALLVDVFGNEYKTTSYEVTANGFAKK